MNQNLVHYQANGWEGNRTYVGWGEENKESKNTSTGIDQEFAAMFSAKNMGDNNRLYIFAHVLSRCIKDANCKPLFQGSRYIENLDKLDSKNLEIVHPFLEYFSEYKNRGELCYLIARLTKYDNCTFYNN